ncbi:hypothetical protein [Salinivibrio sp. IB643]|uniref:hypothetical protein n=1 Tax=Salinivibrio sp. IB643 TaxID=1909445 RepID=UPI0013015880|nr:hypothetical protein [Salinivibrio sp. IB643]
MDVVLVKNRIGESCIDENSMGIQDKNNPLMHFVTNKVMSSSSSDQLVWHVIPI